MHEVLPHMENLMMRPETPADYAAVERLTREAFWNVYRPGCVEHYLLHRLRDSAGYLPQMHTLAVAGDDIAGSIVYSRSRVEGLDGRAWDTLTFGPLSVVPARQRQGIGSALVRHTLTIAREAGERAVLIFGSPDYYGRFGFVPASRHGITLPDGSSMDAFMALPLYPGALDGVLGVFREDAAFGGIRDDAVDAYDEAFPPKVKMTLPGQIF